MTQEKMTAMLSETISVTAEEARAALEARGWNLLEAALLLQARERARRVEANMARRREGRPSSALRALANRFGRANAEAHSEVTAMTELPARVIAPLMILPSGYACRCW